MRLEEYLKRDAELFPGKTAIICEGESVTYSELWERVKRRTEELRAEGLNGLADGNVAKGSDANGGMRIVCIRAYSTIDYVVTYFALHEAGYVAAPLEKDLPEETFNAIAAKLGSYTAPEGSADILYTTGTTGKSKGVIISHRTIEADAENLIDGLGFTHDTVFVINGPLNHIGSLSKIYPIILQGGTIILIDGLKDLNKFFQAFEYESDKMATFLVPASIRMLLTFSGERLENLKRKMDFIETGAAAISQADMEALCKALPHTRLYNTYASTETGIIATYNYNNGRCIAGCLGKTMKNSKLVITDKGLIACSGPTIMTGYIGDPERTAGILKDGVIYTNDVGELDSEGNLHLKGREDDVINVGGFKVAPLEVEDVAMGYPAVADCICIPVENPITGHALKLLVVLKPGHTLNRKDLALYMRSKLEPYKVPMLYQEVEKIERTFNGKLNRKFYLSK